MTNRFYTFIGRAKKTPRFWLRYVLALLLLFQAGVGYGQPMAIPTVISTDLTISVDASCPADCIVMPGVTLRIQSGAVATFNGNLTIERSAKVEIVGATVEMMPAKKILVKGYSATSGQNSIGGSLMANNAVITTSVPGQFWKGIEVEKATITTILSHPASTCVLTNCTLSYSQDGIANFNTTITVLDHLKDSKVEAENVLFLNNKRFSLWLLGALNVTGGHNTFLKFTKCTFAYSLDFPYNPNEMMYIHQSKDVPFLNCTFRGKPVNSSQPAYTIGINGFLASVRIEPDVAGNLGGLFENLKYGIYIANALHTDRTLVIKNALFKCKYAVTLSGCINPLIMGNTSIGPFPGVNNDYSSFYLENCPSYRIMSNTVAYDLGPLQSDFRGIVIRNGGTGNTEVFGNTITTSHIGLQSLGTNKAVNELTGLKFLCNKLQLAQVEEYNITVMKDIVPNSNNGIHRYQYEPAQFFNPEMAAGNKFNTQLPPSSGGYNYYLESGTNNPLQFSYKYSTIDPTEYPTYRNFSLISTSNKNTCLRAVIVNSMIPPFSFDYYKAELKSIEGKITGIENRPSRNAEDTAALQSLYTQQGLLVDSIVNYYQEINSIDSIALVYEQTTKGYHYQVHLSFAYRDLDKYDDAIKLLRGLNDKYSLSEEEEAQIQHLVLC